MARQAGHGDLADKIRGAAKVALSRVELVDLLEKSFNEQPLDTLKALARWAPPEVRTVEHRGAIDIAGGDAEVQQAARILASIGLGRVPHASGNGKDGSVLPDSVPAKPSRH